MMGEVTEQKEASNTSTMLHTLLTPGPFRFQFAGSEIFDELGKKGIDQARETHQRLVSGAEGLNEAMLSSCLTAANVAVALNRKLLEGAVANSNSTLEYAERLLEVKSLAALTELSTAHASKQILGFSEQVRTFGSMGFKAAIEAAQPIKAYAESVARKAA